MKHVAALSSVFDPSTVHRLTTNAVIRRGERYHASGAVTITALTATSVRAHVRGTRRYVVVLDASGHPDWSCTCPAAVDGDFCKHCVAVALELAADGFDGALAEIQNAPAEVSSGKAGHEPHGRSEQDRLVEFLNGRTPERLMAIVLEQADKDWRLRESLLLEADDGGRQIDLGTWTQRIDHAMFVDDYVNWRQAPGWASDVFAVIDALDDLVDQGYAAAVIPLAEHAFRTVEQTVGYVDDSDSGCLSEISERVGMLHFRACTLHPPDPVALARTLVDLEVNSELEGLYHAVGHYADLLGETGLAEYGRLLDSLEAGGRSDRRFTLTSMRRAYLEELQDVDALVAELGRDPRPGDIVAIITALEGAGRVDEAIAAGHSGLARLREARFATSGAIDALAPLLRQKGDNAGAERLYHDDFIEAPTLRTMERLLDAVGDDRDQWLDAAIDEVRERVAVPGRRGARGQRGTAVAHDVLIDILMWAGRHDEAWDAARSGGCHHGRWMQLAATREASHPLDAIEVYEPHAIRLIEAKNNESYAAAVDLMERVRRLADAAGMPERFEALLAIARTTHKPKRNLQRLLDQRGW